MATFQFVDSLNDLVLVELVELEGSANKNRQNMLTNLRSGCKCARDPRVLDNAIVAAKKIGQITDPETLRAARNLSASELIKRFV